MPITFSPAPDKQIESYRQKSDSSTPASLLAAAIHIQDSRTSTRVAEHLQSTFGRDSTQPIPVTPSRNGFVDTVIEAYSNHQALAIRPDDVWISILTQFSLFVNGEGRAEQLRHMFVAHEGKKTLEIFLPGSRYTVDHGKFASLMTEKLQENVVDPELREWCLPDFSTTTANDTVVASVIMMATLKSYFKYVLVTKCGLPRVTLLGTQKDWLEISRRTEALARYGPETTAWRDLLKPVLARFARAFEPGYADSPENLDFWQRVVNRKPGGSSGPGHLSGWITAFCAFDDDGQWAGDKADLKSHQYMQVGQTMQRLASSALGSVTRRLSRTGRPTNDAPVRYLVISPDRVPIGHAEVDVIIEDDRTIQARMVAGLVGASVKDAEVGGTVIPDGELSPVSAWWMFVPEDREARARKAATQDHLRGISRARDYA